ncbi:hypothetical protein [Pontibacter sp. H249]|uniref:hypothetical protein n=1 Tax=Pontibacter sp. H249 TaxID=3133420 RepID=UPI0030C178C1
MKKAFTLMLLASSLSFTAQAQEHPVTQAQVQNYPEEYLNVVVYGNTLRKKLEVQLDAGEGESPKNYIRDADGKKREFASVVAVMNYLNTQGWEFVEYTPDSDGKHDYRRFLMKRHVAM